MTAEHEVSRISGSRAAGARRTIFYGYCTCGRGTTNSANPASVRAKLAKHARGDDSGMTRP